MSSLQPLPPRGASNRRLEERNQKLLAQLETGESSREEYVDFLIEHGKYFFFLEEVLPAEQIQRFPLKSITESEGGLAKRLDYAKAMLRSKAPDYVEARGHNGVQEFVTTLECMKTDNLIASLISKGQSSSAKKRIWSADIFARPLVAAKGSEVAHLLPDAPDHAIEWYDVAAWAIGLNPENTDWGTLFRLLHGTKGSDKKRVHGSGMRHFTANKARINEQEKVLDNEDPQLLILPIRDRRRCLDWNGEDYEAIVLVGADAAKSHQSQLRAAKSIGMTDCQNIIYLEATNEELQEALLLLEEFTYAMVQSLVNFTPPRVPPNATEDEIKSMQDATTIRKNRRESFLADLGSNSVPVPRRDNPGPVGDYRAICKIRFGASDGLHPAPDPMLLVARAAVVWSVRHGIRLRASTIPQDDVGAEWERQVAFLANLNRTERVNKEVQNLEVAVEQRMLQDADSETSSVSSEESHVSEAASKRQPEQEPASYSPLI